MSRVEFIEKLDALSEEIRLHEPEDIRRVKQRNRPAKKNFGALLFAFLDMEAANPDIYRLICMAQARQGELATLKAIADGVLGWNEGGFEGSYDTVSYTHLDVYKRQVPSRPPIPGRH